MSALALLSTSVAGAQSRRVTGHVFGYAGEPIARAGLSIQATDLRTTTGADGRFVVDAVPSGDQVLIIVRPGYKSVFRRVPAGAEQLDVRLEVQIITGIATTVSSANSPTDVAVVSGHELNRVPAPTLENTLQGRVAGAVVTTNSGAPGGGAQVQLRGVSTASGAVGPLYVVDGVIVNNAEIPNGLSALTGSQDQWTNRISDLSPSDIESVEVLKGPSASAIYGSKGTNGVIIITTKQGARGAPVVSLGESVGQFSISHKLGLRCFGSAAEAIAAGFDGAGWTAATTKCNDFEQQFYSGNSPSYESTLSVRGGTDATTYYVGGLAKTDNAIEPGTYYKKQALTANIGQGIGGAVTLHSNNQLIHSLTDRGISGNNNTDDVSPGEVFAETPTWVNLAAGGVNPYSNVRTNPFQSAQLVKIPEEVNRYIGSLGANWSAWSSSRQTFDVMLLGGVDEYWHSSNLYSPPEVYFENSDGLPGTVVTDRTSSTNTSLNLSGLHKLMGTSWTATTSFGLRQESRELHELINEGQNLPSGVMLVSAGQVQSSSESRSTVKDRAYYAQEELLALDHRLLLTAAVDAERSSVDQDSAKLYTYPKLSASYRLPFLPEFTDELKVRVAYGMAGNQPPPSFRIVTVSGNCAGQLAPTGPDPDCSQDPPFLKPETSREIEGGVDAQFAGGRITLDATIFERNVSDLVMRNNIAASTGFGSLLVNGGGIRSTGTELGLSVTPIQRNDFSWVSRATYGSVNSRVTSLAVPCFTSGTSFSLRFGAPYFCGGFSPTDVQVDNGFDTTFTCGPANACHSGGFVSRVRHVSNFESAPNFSMGFSNDFDVGPLRIHTLLDWRSGGYVANLTNNYFDAEGNATTGTLADTAAAHARNIGFSTAGGGLNEYLEPAGFVKLRELALSVPVPSNVTTRLFSGASDIRIELSGRNLKTWTKYTGYDPEVSNFGNQTLGRFQDVTPYPPSRSVFLSLRANL